MSLVKQVEGMANVDIFKRGKNDKFFVGRPFYLDYEKACLLVCDKWKHSVGGIPQGAFLLAFYENEENVKEAILLRVLRPSKLPTESDIISSMVEYYKDSSFAEKTNSNLDDFTRYEFSFSGVECRVLGTFYKTLESQDSFSFGADVENFFSAHNYSVYKAQGDVLEYIVNLKDNLNRKEQIPIGKVRYSSSMRIVSGHDVPVYVSPNDFLGKRTALFGMTRTGKSNTVKKIIQATQSINHTPKTGQIIFDVNGEYANANLQDEGTAIFEIYQDDVVRYSVVEKAEFEVLKVDFYNEIEAGFQLIKSALADDSSDYIKSFLSIDLSKSEDISPAENVRFNRIVAAFLCCLYKANFPVSIDKVTFSGHNILNKLVDAKGNINPSKGISLKDATHWFEVIWDNYETDFFDKYKEEHRHEWADGDLKSLLVMLTRKTSPGRNPTISGFRKLDSLRILHSNKVRQPFQHSILKALRDGKIVIIDLSQGSEEIQKLYSERICQYIFVDSMNNFVRNIDNNYIQFYFEEAHNLFPKKDDKNLSQIYNRIAKEGAKLNLGLLYATQEVSSISSNILKNTQNWFIAHLNNEDEIKELRKYYDFCDFTDSLIRFSADTDKGFVRMKTYSNPFIVPVQIDKFSVEKN